MVMVGFYLGVAFGLILSLLIDELEKVWKQAVRREAALAVLATQQQSEETK
jgi:hypothetical protein